MRLFTFVVLLLAACATATPPPDPADLDIRATVIAEYNVISGQAGRRDWDRFKELFAPDAKIDGLTPADYVTQKKPWFDAVTRADKRVQVVKMAERSFVVILARAP